MNHALLWTLAAAGIAIAIPAVLAIAHWDRHLEQRRRTRDAALLEAQLYQAWRESAHNDSDHA